MKMLSQAELQQISGGSSELSDAAFGLFLTVTSTSFIMGAYTAYQTKHDYINGLKGQVAYVKETIADLTSRIDKIVGSHDFHQPVTGQVNVSSR